MTLNFQTQADVRDEVVESLIQLKTPATLTQIAEVTWFRCAIDGTRPMVQGTVNGAIRAMVDEGLVESVRFEDSQHYFQLNVLARLALIPK